MTVFKNTSWNLLGSVVPMLVGIVAMPYIYQSIGIERIGVLTIVWALIGYFSIFDFGLGRAITQRIASLAPKDDYKKRNSIATTGVMLTLVIGVFGCFIGILAFELVGVQWVVTAPDLEQEVRNSFLLGCLAIPATTATAGLRGILEGEQRFKAINLLRLALGLSNFLGPIASIAFFGPRLDYTVGSLVLARYIILFAHHLGASNAMGGLAIDFSRQESKQLFLFGGWMTVSNIISPLMVTGDRFFMGGVVGASTLAYYTITVDLLFRILIVPAALSTTLFPLFSKDSGNEKKISRYYNGALGLVFLFMASLTIIIYFVGDILFEFWLGTAFAENSHKIAIIISLGILFNGMAQIPFAYIQATGDSKSTLVIHVIEFIIYVPVLVGLIRIFGITGAAMAWTIRAGLDLLLLHCRAINIRHRIGRSHVQTALAVNGVK